MLNRQADYSRTYSALDPNQRSAGPMSAPMAGRWTVLDTPRLSTLLAWMDHASSRRRFMRRTTIARRVTTRLWTASPWLACRSLLLGAIGTRRNVAPPWALLAHSRSVLATASACLRHVSAPRVSATLRHPQARAPTVPPDYHLRQILSSLGYSPSLCASDFSPRRRVTTLQRVLVFFNIWLRRNWLTPILSTRHTY